MSFTWQYANLIIFKNQPANFEAPLLTHFHVILLFVCLGHGWNIFWSLFFLFSRSISQDTATVNRFTFPHSKVLSGYFSPPWLCLSSLTNWLFLLNLRLNWRDRLIQGVMLTTVPLQHRNVAIKLGHIYLSTPLSAETYSIFVWSIVHPLLLYWKANNVHFQKANIYMHLIKVWAHLAILRFD